MTTTIHQGDCRSMSAIATGSIHCIATSPPYWGLRSYLAANDPAKGAEIGGEETPEGYVESMIAVGRECWRVLRDDGVMWINLGDTYAGGGRGPVGQTSATNSATMQAQAIGNATMCDAPPKSLLLIPFRVALALQADGWILRAAIPWLKGSGMPESVQDRPTTAHETVFLFAKRERYYFDADAVRVAHARGSAEHVAKYFTDAAGAGYSNKHAAHGTGNGHTQLRAMGKLNPAGRNIRTSDFHAVSLDVLSSDLAAYQAHLAHVRAAGGLLLTPEGEPAAFLVNPVPSPYKHFAMWPPALVRPMILSGTSERGCCPACGAGWRRVVDVSGETARDKLKERGASAYAESQPKNAQGLDYAGSHGANADGRSLRGWIPSCPCPPSAPIPCTVLDPFAGTATTLRVAEDCGRHAIGYELNRAYLPIAAERTAQQGLFAMDAVAAKEPQ